MAGVSTVTGVVVKLDNMHTGQTLPTRAGEVRGSATISPCGRYRYLLERLWGSGPSATFVMLNPSTADAETDDPTIRRCIAFTKAWGCNNLSVVNLYGLRATDPRELRRADDPVGPGNDEAIWQRLMIHSSWEDWPIVAAWGTKANPYIVRRMLDRARGAGVNFSCLGVTMDGHPRHPLYLPRTAELVRWPNGGHEGGRTP